MDTNPNHPDFERLPLIDSEWTEENWKDMLEHLVLNDIVNYKEITSLVLGHLNPSQVGTSIASKKTFQAHYPPRQTWQAVREWHLNQVGRCEDCGTRLELQADHVVPKQLLGDAADTLDNLTLRCRRCNVIRRPSHHLNGGRTYLTTESALMWILFTKKPKTYEEFQVLCRQYGLTMANIRFEEAWAMARWLHREGRYEILDHSRF